jgi:hypothetical protein
MARRVLIGIVAAAVVAMGAYSLLHRTSLAFTLGVSPTLYAATLDPEQSVCQTPIDVPAAFDRLTLAVATYGQPGPQLLVAARGPRLQVLSEGRLGGGYRAQAETVGLNRRVTAPRIQVCIQNLGSRRVSLYGNRGLAARGSTAVREGHNLNTDIAITFQRPPRSLASELGAMAQRSDLFRFPGMSPWIYLALAVALVVAGPWLLLRALRSALTWPADER